MKKIHLPRFLFFVLLLSACLIDNKSEAKVLPCPVRIDSTSRVPFAALKINLIQMVFHEIPVSFELYLKEKRSIQFQVGYLFSNHNKYGQYFGFGQNATATPEGFWSYRLSPFNDHGLSFKFEFRQYGKKFYFGPQLMYKHCYYKELSFPVFGGGSITRDYVESKNSNILGMALIMGRSDMMGKIIFDWYGAVGLRVRAMSITTNVIYDSPRPPTYPNTTEEFDSVYPFVNLGVRLGIQLMKNAKGNQE